jgi:hypothetical protein
MVVITAKIGSPLKKKCHSVPRASRQIPAMLGHWVKVRASTTNRFRGERRQGLPQEQGIGFGHNKLRCLLAHAWDDRIDLRESP